ncbi:MAG: pyrroloquinoline quinone-dependent dehydrogenase [Acidobacteria bacterium]|nr:MAG: pyrroloquinoline quinone-dependent dehydrogenase [Acidobacteriota bacterium]
MSYCHAVLGVRCSPQRVTRTRSDLHPRSIFMCRFGRFVVLAAGLFAAALLAHSFLVVTGGGLVTGVRGQARPGSALSTNGARGAGPYTTWKAYGGGADSSQYSALNQINKSNVSQLQVVWTFPVTGTVIFNPLVVDGVMYLQASGNTLVAVDAATGKEIWRRQTQGAMGGRGMNYWESPDRSDRRLLFIAGGYLTAINAQTGDAIAGFGDNGRVDLRIALYRQAAQPLQTGNPGRIFENTMIVSLPAQGASYDATPADVQAYDVRTGRIQWVFHSIPHPGEFGYDTWPPEAYKKSGGVHNWSESTVDERRGIAFINFGSPRFDFYGGDRPGNNLFGNSLVALDARTGKRIWHHQLVHHDLWDYDLPQAPKLLTIRQNGRTIDVVAQATKQGFLFVFERETGRPIWPIDERPVPQSDVPGEHSSPTQPFPTRPAPFARQTFTGKDVNPYLPAVEREALVQRFKFLRNEGLFTPPSFEGSISMPGHNGGANFATSAVDPIRGEMYVVAKALPTVDRLTLPGQGGRGGGGGGEGPIVTPEQKAQMIDKARELLANGGPLRLPSPYEFMNQNSLRMSASGPPWSEMTAYDLNTGEIRWRIPTGTVLAPPELGIPPNTGSHFPRGGPLVTAGGLVFFATGSDRRFRAYDRDSGQEVWSMELLVASEGMPATYEIHGRQFIVVPVAAGIGLFAPRFGGAGPVAGRGVGVNGGVPAPERAPGDPPEQQAVGRGGAGGPPGQYIVLALKQ